MKSEIKVSISPLLSSQIVKTLRKAICIKWPYSGETKSGLHKGNVNLEIQITFINMYFT